MELFLLEFGKRLKEARQRKKLTQEELAKKVNTKKTTISNYETGYSTPAYDMLRDLSETLEVTTDWLIGVIDSTIDEAHLYYSYIKETEINVYPKIYDQKMGTFQSIISDEFVDLPVLGTIYAGTPLDRIENYEGTFPVLKRTINGYEAFWLRVKGESMSGDEIHDGDLVCIIKTTEINPSDIAAVAVNGDEATLKRVKFLDGQCILTPSNREMEPMIYPANKIYIIGKVVGFQRYYK